MKIHVTRNGTKIKLCEMTNSHLAATIRLRERKAKEGIVVRYGDGSCLEDIWYDEDHLFGDDVKEHMNYNDYVIELNSRKTNQRIKYENMETADHKDVQ